MADNLIGQSRAFLACLDKTAQLAPIMRPVLILGERGTGKELIAQRLHYLSPRWREPLVSLNCSALSEGLMESELFGHESGAFTGAKQKHLGRFERAHNGSLFLDELGTMPLSLQEKLLRVIEYGQYERVGGRQMLQADVRLICATNQDLPAMAAKGEFRYDLLDRLAFDVIHLPPLREREEDILLLAEHFAIAMCQELKRSHFTGFSEAIKHALLSYSWPGNVRELKNVIERAVYQHSDPDAAISALEFNPFARGKNLSNQQAYVSSTEKTHELPTTTQQATPKTEAVDISLPLDLKAWQHQNEQQMLHKALQEAEYNQKKAAQLLCLSYHQLRGLLRKHQI